MVLFLSTLDIGGRLFEGVGISPGLANDALVAGLERYGTAHKLADDWFVLPILDVAVREIVPGRFYCDREPA